MNRKKICYVILCILLIAMIPTIVTAASFYFDDGKDENNGRSVYGVWKAIEKYKSSWVTATKPTYTNWGGEYTYDEYGTSLIFRPSALCLGHQKQSVAAGSNKYTIKTIIDVNQNTTNYNNLVIGYTIAKNIQDKKENIDNAENSNIEATEGPIKPYILKYVYENRLLGSKDNVKYETSDVEYTTAAKNYANSNKNRKVFSTNTNSAKQQIKVVNGNTFIGPYTLKSYGGRIERAVVKTREGKTYTTTKYSSNGSKINGLGRTSKYESNTFYIVVEGVEVESVESITLYKTYEQVAYARLVIFQSRENTGQNLGLYYGYMKDLDVMLKLPGVPYSTIKIAKKDADTGKNIAGMGLVLYSEEAKGYLVKGTPCSYTTDINKATEFMTTTGTIEIKNVPKAGKYIVYETTSLPELGYEFVSKENPLKVEEFTISGIGQPANVVVENKKQYMHLHIVKLDADSKQPLPNIGLILYDVTEGKYIIEGNPGEPPGYMEHSGMATAYMTDKNGSIEIQYLKRGHQYIIYEIINPYYGYEEVSRANPIELARFTLTGSSMDFYITADNIKYTGNLFIEKKDPDNSNIKLQGVQFTLRQPSTTEEENALQGFVEGKGDLNSNGYLDQEDLKILLRYITGKVQLTSEQMDMANVNMDRTVDTTDLRLLQQKISSLHYVIAMQEDENGILQPMKKVTGTVHFDNMRITNNIEEATIFETDENAEVNIYNILTGDYIVEEYSVGDNFGYEIDPGYVSWEVRNEFGETSILENQTSAYITVSRQASYSTSEDAAAQGNQNGSYVTSNNTRKYIKIRGYAWEDVIEGDKNSHKDGEWQDGSNDKRLANIPVRLIDEFGNVLAQTVTDANGEYVFGNYDEDENATKIEIDDIIAAYIEFEYNGMCYRSLDTNVNFVADINVNTGAVIRTNQNRNAATDERLRDEFNNNYATITQGSENNTDDTKHNTAYNGEYDIRYNYDAESNESHVNYGDNALTGYEGQKYPIARVDEQYSITAVTQQYPYYALCTQLTAQNIREQAVEEIAGLNLGVVEREMPDLFVIEDMQKVEISLDGDKHTYYYNQRFEDPANYAGGEQINASVKFANKYLENSYSRDVYSSDISYDANTSEDALQIYVTYRIQIKNEASSVNTKVNMLTNYYDNRYEVVSVKDNGDRDVRYFPSGSVEGTGLNKITITPEDEKNYPIIPDGESRDYWITYKLNNDGINSILNETLTLDSITEVTSYSSYEDEAGQIPYAGIDKDSAVDTTEPEINKDSEVGRVDITRTLEDDTDKAPSLILNLKEGRIIRGTVWEDSAIQDLLDNEGYDKERKGDGEYDPDNENIVQNVQVELMKVNDDGTYTRANLYQLQEGENAWEPLRPVDAVTRTNEQGEYKFVGVVPDVYVIKYTYGNISVTENGEEITYTSVIVDPETKEEITDVDVDDYKSTIYRGGTPPDENDLSWYREETTGTDAPRYSDAKDTLGIIPGEDPIDIVQERIKDEEINYETVTEDSKLEAISADTARFYVKMDYDVSQPNISYYPEREEGNTLKFTFDNIDFGIIERPKQDLEIKKEIAYVHITLANGSTLISGDPRSPNLTNVQYLDDALYIQIDNELIQGATMTLHYEISVDNTRCEVDYNNADYYIYGNVPEDHADWKIATVVDMYDYLPADLVFQESNTNNWERVTIQASDRGTILSEEVYDSVNGLQNVIHLETPIFEDMEPGRVRTTAESNSNIVVSRQLSTSSDELTYENDIEIIKLKGLPPDGPTPGNYDPIDNTPKEADDDHAPVTITGPYGNNRQYLLYGILGISALIVIGVGIIIIKKKVL